MLLAKRSEDAFRLAQAQKEMETYAKALGEDGTTEECTCGRGTYGLYDIIWRMHIVLRLVQI